MVSDPSDALVRAALTDDLRQDGRGHCYVASEALWHLLGRPRTLRPHVVHHDGGTHWYLMDREGGIVLDLTADQFRTRPPYERGRCCGFLTRRPSRRAQVVIERVRQAAVSGNHRARA